MADRDGPLVGTALPPYSGPAVRCQKCGGQGASTRFLARGVCDHDGSGLSLGRHSNERLHRECDICGYAWDEATVQPQHPSTAEPGDQGDD